MTSGPQIRNKKYFWKQKKLNIFIGNENIDIELILLYIESVSVYSYL